MQEGVALLRLQPGRTTRNDTRNNAMLAFSAIVASPPVHGISVNAQKFGHLGRRFPGCQQINGPLSPPLQYFLTSLWSHTVHNRYILLRSLTLSL
jgi:hypothetical protein